MRVNVTCTLELCSRPPPRGRVGIATAYIAWDLASLEEPDTDVSRSPLRSVDTTSDRIEAVAVAIGRVGVDRTPGIGILTRRMDVAVRGSDASCESTIVGKRASGIGV